MGSRFGRFAPFAPYLVALASGLLWGAAFGREPWIVSAWLVLAPLVVLLGHPKAGRLAFLHGFAAWSFGLSWIPATLTSFGGLPKPVAVLCLLILASYLALFSFAFGRFGRRLWLRGGAWAFLGLPALWVALEWLRAHLIGGFPWNLAAYAWVDVPGALPLSAWIGAYGISFLVLFANVGIALVWTNPSPPAPLPKGEGSQAKASLPVPPSPSGRGAGGEGWFGTSLGTARIRLVPLGLALLVPLLLLGVAGRAGHRSVVAHHIARMEQGDFGRPVRIVQPNLPIRKDWDPAAAYADYRKAMDLAVESCEPGALVVLPESALWPYSYERDPALRRELAGLVARGCSVVWNGQAEASETEIFNSAYLLAPTEPALTRYDKRRLVPFGEYIPFSPILGWVGRMARGIGEYTPGREVKLLPWNAVPAPPGSLAAMLPPARDLLGMAICYEAVYPEEVAELSKAGATLLATVTNDAWYGDTAAPRQHLRAARFRAAENRKTLLRAALTGISSLIAPDGSERQSVALGTTGVIRARVWGESGLTPYARAPWLPPLLCSLGALFAIIRLRPSRREKQAPESPDGSR